VRCRWAIWCHALFAEPLTCDPYAQMYRLMGAYRMEAAAGAGMICWALSLRDFLDIRTSGGRWAADVGRAITKAAFALHADLTIAPRKTYCGDRPSGRGKIDPFWALLRIYTLSKGKAALAGRATHPPPPARDHGLDAVSGQQPVPHLGLQECRPRPAVPTCAAQRRTIPRRRCACTGRATDNGNTQTCGNFGRAAKRCGAGACCGYARPLCYWMNPLPHLGRPAQRYA